MTVQDLRIGNWVQQGILQWKVGYTDMGPGVEKIQAIPLTEEWLVRLGFVEHKSSPEMRNYTSSLDGGPTLEFVVTETGKLWIMEFCGVEWSIQHPRLEYVHQLQNLYFALTGKELIIK